MKKTQQLNIEKNKKLIREISFQKKEPEWMLNLRIKALELFNKKPNPSWMNLEKLDYDDILYYVRPNAKLNAESWDEVPEEIKNTFEKLGIPEAEQKVLSGVGAQYESQNVYHKLKDEWKKKGIIFEDMDLALKKYPRIVKKYFSKCIPLEDHKFSLLHYAFWSGGTFVYIPKNVKAELPLQAYFRMNTQGMGQFEHTLIILEENSELHYIEGCSSPVYMKNNIHSGCVEIFVQKNARMRYSSVENWSKNTYNLNTKRAIIEENSIMEWVSGNLGSGVTMLYPATILKGENSKADNISIVFAGKDQNQDVGAKAIHLGKNTSSTITSKSISKNGGISTYRGFVKIAKTAENAKSQVKCDALLFENSISKTIPVNKVLNKTATVVHEATAGKISYDQLFYLMSRGLKEEDATRLIVSGFIEPLTRELPLEYALELNKLIELEMKNSIG